MNIMLTSMLSSKPTITVKSLITGDTTANASTSEAGEGRTPTDSTTEKYINEGKELLNKLIEIIKECEAIFGDRSQLATEEHLIICKLYETWEDVLYFGLKPVKNSILHSIITGNGLLNEASFWDISKSHLTNHELERFELDKKNLTKHGKVRALLCAALNERSLERYLLMWLSDPGIVEFYESWAIMLNEEAQKILPNLARDLSLILFAINIDKIGERNDRRENKKIEPIIFVTRPSDSKKKRTATKRRIVCPEEDESQRYQQNVALEEGIRRSTEIEIPSSLKTIGEEVHIDSVEEVAKCINRVFLNGNGKAASTDSSRTSSNPGSNPNISSILMDIEKDSDIMLENGSISRDSISTKDSISSLLLLNAKEEISSTPSTTSIVSDEKNDYEKLQDNLKYFQERCTELEIKISELTLENSRLRRLLGGSSSSDKIIVNIPHAVLVTTRGKQHYAYKICIRILETEVEWNVLKRYSEFYSLNQTLKKLNTAVKNLDFPPKKKLRNMDSALVEERRQRLQIYLRQIINLFPEISSCRTKDDFEKCFPFFR